MNAYFNFGDWLVIFLYLGGIIGLAQRQRSLHAVHCPGALGHSQQLGDKDRLVLERRGDVKAGPRRQQRLGDVPALCPLQGIQLEQAGFNST